MNSKSEGCIFNIQHYSLHDGEGIRTIVFLKGCPLRCKWCSNPESQHFYPERVFYQSKCIGIDQCSFCVNQCPDKAIEAVNGKIVINLNQCNRCMKCVSSCPAKALDVLGVEKSIGDILDIVERDSLFYKRSNGGLTLSGGEPLAQPEFAINLLKAAKSRYIHTVLETCGYVEWDILAAAAEYLDTILYDIKCLDNDKHISYTGVSNKRILKNFEQLCEHFPNINIIARTPVIPTFNDSKKELDEILAYIRQINGNRYEFLPYHRLGTSKYEALGIDYPLGNNDLEINIKEYISGGIS